MDIHIGKRIKEVLTERNMTFSKVAVQVGMTPQNLNGLFKRKSIDLALLKKFVDVVDYDFFADLARKERSMASEPAGEYNQRRAVQVTVSLDGTAQELNYWISTLRGINATLTR